MTYQWAETDTNGKARLYQEYPTFSSALHGTTR
jgi:hypothetical protein